MPTVIPPESRKFERHARVTGGLPGRLIGTHPIQTIDARAIDVSRHGIGIVAGQKLLPGSEVWLLMADRSLKLEVRYCSASADNAGGFRCGLQSKTPDEDVKDIFLQTGLVALSP